MRNIDDAALGDQTPARRGDESLLRFAMLSVYYASLGRQLEARGAPSVLLPPRVRPLDLATALGLLEKSPLRLREALWLIVRGVRAQGLPSNRRETYPPEFLDYIVPGSIDVLRELRRDYRSGANLFAAALVACRDGFWDQFAALATILRDKKATRPGFSAVTNLMLGMTAADYLTYMSVSDRQRAKSQRQIERLECDVGLNVYDFVEELADAAAFQQFTSQYLRNPPPSRTGLTVFPVSSIIRQDSKTLLTNATVTTLARGDFDILRQAVDPQAWSRSSDVIQSAQYVSDAFDLSEVRRTFLPPMGAGFPGIHLLDEHAVMAWGENDDQQASFRNVLNIKHTVGAKDTGQRQFIDVDFSLRRSIESTVLWDRRAGGLQVNQGYIKVRPLGNNTWRVTSRKIIRFSDRTPSVGGSWLDFGQMLNYLAPASLTWWVESETYSMGDTAQPDSEASSPVLAARSSEAGF